MKNRFVHEREKNSRNLSLLIQIGIFFVSFALFAAGIQMLSSKSLDYQEENLKKAIMQDIVYCYAQDGRYPESLDYIRETCGLVYNEKLFFVDYRPYGNNILPDYTVIRIQEEGN